MEVTVQGRGCPHAVWDLTPTHLMVRIDDHDSPDLWYEVEISLDDLRVELRIPAPPAPEFDVGPLIESVLRTKHELVQTIEQSKNDVLRVVQNYLTMQPVEPIEDLPAAAKWARARLSNRWCHHGPECPYCLTLCLEQPRGDHGELVCLHCQQRYGWTATLSPLSNPAFTTWRPEEFSRRNEDKAGQQLASDN